jgi:hypothetical protein
LLQVELIQMVRVLKYKALLRLLKLSKLMMLN